MMDDQFKAIVINQTEDKFTREVKNLKKSFFKTHSLIITTKTTMNTQIKGQDGYKQDNVLDQIAEVKELYEQYKWIIK